MTTGDSWGCNHGKDHVGNPMPETTTHKDGDDSGIVHGIAVFFVFSKGSHNILSSY